MILKKIYIILSKLNFGNNSEEKFKRETDSYKKFFAEDEMPELSSELGDKIWTDIKNRANSNTIEPMKIRYGKYTRYAAAIAGFIFFISGLFLYNFYNSRNNISLRDELIRYKTDVYDSVWTLTDDKGNSISLDSVKENVIYAFNDQKIIRHSDTVIYLKGKNNINIMHVPARQIVHVKMNDGTVITANANTTLSYNTDYLKSGERMTAIDGEALFQVVHNNANPFAVITNRDTLFDIGTDFTVKNFLGDSSLFAGVSEGCVRIGSDLINKGIEVKVNYSGKNVHIEKENLRTALFWNSDVFCFRQAGMQEIVHSLERWYGIKINWNKHSDFTFSGNLPKQLPVPKILEIINELSESNLTLADKNTL